MSPRRPAEATGLRAQQRLDVAFYEDTFFFAFTIAEVPKFLGNVPDCLASVIPFDPTAQSSALQSQLSQLGREEQPEDSNVGELFTDRINLTCA
ncbi:MAG: DUF1007 family protein [Arenibacterium sp.]